ncbi:hypothetical protein AVEN_82579-1 [Araneus ventricosus]|uniref:Uncharacterized protein n=1 Tax=Araneus ventricosus TaxID=182803 RepID=A0A4Y2IVQ0_ARAVE|nr:hypothetical protein AVEN_82579-1 [Araneus ventricosus]
MVLWQCPCTITIEGGNTCQCHWPVKIEERDPSLDSWVQKIPERHHSTLCRGPVRDLTPKGYHTEPNLVQNSITDPKMGRGRVGGK